MRWFKVYAAEILSDTEHVSLTLEERGLWLILMALIAKNGTCGYLVNKSTGEPIPEKEILLIASRFYAHRDQNVTRMVTKITKMVKRLYQNGIFHFREDGAFGSKAWVKYYNDYERKYAKGKNEQGDFLDFGKPENAGHCQPKTPSVEVEREEDRKDYVLANTNDVVDVVSSLNTRMNENRGEKKNVSNSKLNHENQPLNPDNPGRDFVTLSTAKKLLDQLFNPDNPDFAQLRVQITSLLDQFTPESQLRALLMFKTRVVSKNYPDYPFSYIKTLLIKFQTEEDALLETRRKEKDALRKQVLHSLCCDRPCFTSANARGEKYIACSKCEQVVDTKGVPSGYDVHGLPVRPVTDDVNEKEPK